MIAATFHFSASELWSMTIDDMQFWLDQAKWINNPPG